LAVALWNYAEPGASGPEKVVTIELRNSTTKSGLVHRVDASHHSTLEEWIRMGRPVSPIPSQIARLRAIGAAAKPESIKLRNGHADIRIPAPGFVLLEIGGQ
jgi:hypothetical protein